MFRKIFVLILAPFCFSTIFADTEFIDSVPLELVKALLGNAPYGEPTLYSDLSSAFPRIDVPDELEIMGSIERGYGIAAVYSTVLSKSETESAFGEAFVKAGYIEFELPGMRRSESGFVRPSTNVSQTLNRFCHDSLGSISLTYSVQEEGGIATISANPANDNRSCADQLAEQQQIMGRMGGRQSGLQQYFPRMELPEPEPNRYSPFFSGGGFSGSNNRMETETNLNVAWEIQEVFNHLSQQISDQEWVVDSEIIGTASASASWTRSPEPGMDLIGSLTILKSAEDSFELKFQLITVGTNSNIRPALLRSN